VIPALVAAAHAFCGTYIGAPGASLTNRTSVVVIARAGEETTLTLAPDYAGDLTEFALVVPVPAGTTAEQIGTGDADAVDFLDQYSVPRGVAYTCDDLFTATSYGCATQLGCAAASSEFDGLASELGAAADDGVEVEASFAAAEYELVLLSAEDGDGLWAWLDDNGYAVPEGGEDVLQEYVDAGTWFLAARVRLDAAPEEGARLTPLTVRSTGEGAGLPIRIGTISAAGEQEVVVLFLDDDEVGVSNYPELSIRQECMWRGDDLGAAYEDQLADALVEVGGAGWVREYSWDLTQKCDPCTTQQVVDEDLLTAVGADPWEAHLTRMRVRYTPATAEEDLVFYETGRYGVTEQIRLVRYAEELESWFPLCDEGWVEDPGQCPAFASPGCAVPTVPAAGASLLAALVLARRRR
jgi:hypothetical protein